MENKKTTESFKCHKCKTENEFNPRDYDKKSNELLMEMLTPFRTVVIKCKHCNADNSVSVKRF
jgi:DNA-directed RNA polymerase subunit RPC12/RpoP